MSEPMFDDIIPPEHHFKIAEALAATVPECVGSVDEATDVLLAAAVIALAGDRSPASVIAGLRRVVDIAAASIVELTPGVIH